MLGLDFCQTWYPCSLIGGKNVHQTSKSTCIIYGHSVQGITGRDCGESTWEREREWLRENQCHCWASFSLWRLSATNNLNNSFPDQEFITEAENARNQSLVGTFFFLFPETRAQLHLYACHGVGRSMRPGLIVPKTLLGRDPTAHSRRTETEQGDGGAIGTSQ